MVSILSEWSSANKVKLGDFEKDPRFLKLCRILARSTTSQAMTSLTMAEDLSTVLGITGDDEAARLIANLTLPQMVKVSHDVFYLLWYILFWLYDLWYIYIFDYIVILILLCKVGNLSLVIAYMGFETKPKTRHILPDNNLFGRRLTCAVVCWVSTMSERDIYRHRKYRHRKYSLIFFNTHIHRALKNIVSQNYVSLKTFITSLFCV